jgi:7-carboxy-7-deazaguanine synthase
MSTPTLRITEIFHSLQGETRTVGLPTTFVRLTGCPLRCGYCDTAYAFHGGTVRSLEDVVEEVAARSPRFVTVTGGEPLAQPACLPLLTMLCDLPGVREVSLETSGALDVSAVDPRVVKVLDLKTPGSGECHRNHWENLAQLNPHDQVKFVLCDRTDYEWARLKLAEHRLEERVAEVLFSPVHEGLPPARLADWIVEDRLPVRLQLQLHKYLWGDEPGR